MITLKINGVGRSVGLLALLLAIGIEWVPPKSALSEIRRTDHPSSFAPVTPEVALLIKQALEDRYRWRNIPDGLSYGAPEALLSSELVAARLSLTMASRPERPGTEFILLSRAGARALADRTDSGVHVFFVDEPRIANDAATLVIGTSLVMPASFRGGLQCCCRAVGHFGWRDGRWHFVKWGQTSCG